MYLHTVLQVTIVQFLPLISSQVFITWGFGCSIIMSKPTINKIIQDMQFANTFIPDIQKQN